MRCDHDLLLDHLDGETDDARRREVDEHLAGCEACRGVMDAYREDLELVCDAVAEGAPESLTDAELSDLLSTPELREDETRTGRWGRLLPFGPRTAAALALAACVAAALFLMPPPAEEASTISPTPIAVAEADDRVEIRMATGNPSIQVIWVMSKDVEF